MPALAHSDGITVVIPSIPPRIKLLTRALLSVQNQTLQPASTVVVIDHSKEGAPRTRQRGLDAVQTEWVAFLDDDDELLPRHLQMLMETARETGADLVYPWFTVIGGTDPFPEYFRRPWNDDEPHQVPITFLARTDAVRACDGFIDHLDGDDVGTDPMGNRAGEDYRLVLRMVKNKMKIVHLPEKSWSWYHNSGNTSGLPSRW